MRSGCLRLLWKALLVALVIGGAISLVGWFLGWRQSIQFSDGLFWAGAGVMALGLIIMVGGQGTRANIGMLYSESAGDRLSERTRLWVRGLTEDYGTLLYLLLGGAALFGISMLVEVLGRGSPRGVP